MSTRERATAPFFVSVCRHFLLQLTWIGSIKANDYFGEVLAVEVERSDATRVGPLSSSISFSWRVTDRCLILFRSETKCAAREKRQFRICPRSIGETHIDDTSLMIDSISEEKKKSTIFCARFCTLKPKSSDTLRDVRKEKKELETIP